MIPLAREVAVEADTVAAAGAVVTVVGMMAAVAEEEVQGSIPGL
jgi:hypothetical protein